MTDSNFIKILGTAGARHVVARQLRSSAGTFLSIEGKRILLDPGPGTLVRLAKSKPAIDVTGLDAIILSHRHIDHTNDVNILIDGMTAGGLQRKGSLFATSDALGPGDPVVLHYLRGFLEEIVTLEEGKEYSLGPVRFSTSVRHRHPVETYGLSFDAGGRTVSFLVDTAYFPELAESYRGTDVLIINLVRREPREIGLIQHLCLDDVRALLAEIRPGRTILTHFGMTMHREKPSELAAALAEELGLDVAAASDGMTIELS